MGKGFQAWPDATGLVHDPDLRRRAEVFGFGTMLVLAFISSTWLAWWRARREGLDPEVILDMAFWVFVSGLVGARLFYCIQYWGEDIHNLWESCSTGRGASSTTAGSSAASAAFFVYRRFRPFPFRPYLDAARAVDRPRDVLRPARLLPERLLLSAISAGCPGRFPFPAYSPPWVPAPGLGLIACECHSLAAGPSHPALLGHRRPGPLAPVDGLLSAPAARRRGDGALDADLPDHAVPDRVSAERRGRVLRRADDLAEHQRAAAAGWCSVLGLALVAAQGAVPRSPCTRDAAD